MSYILESLKKSERERQQQDSKVLAAMTPAPFLENVRPQPRLSWQSLLLFLMLIAILVTAIYYGMNIFNANDKEIVKAAVSETTNKLSPTDKGVYPSARDTVENIEEGVDQNRADKQAAVALYQQTVQKNSSQAVDKLYQRIGEEEQIATTSLSARSVTGITQSVQPAVATADTNSSSTTDTNSSEPSIPPIPSIYSLDQTSKRSIPKIDYGAHVYASDNKSGFVILNGARARIGDHLGNGVYIEKIEEDSVILSYSGVLFSLPAMKSWSGE